MPPDRVSPANPRARPAPIGPPAPAAPDPGSRTVARQFSRADVIRLGQAGGGTPWQFIPVAAQALRIAPDDAGIRFLIASHYARLLLVTAAREQLALLPEHARQDASVRTLDSLVRQLPDDRIPPAERLATCRANVEALASRPTGAVDLRPAFDSWAQRTARTDWFRTRDGNIVTRPAGAPADGQWLRFRDDQAEVAAMMLPVAPGPLPPIALEGVDPPWMLMRILSQTPRAADGYWARVTVVQADAEELLDGLAAADLREQLAQDRLHFFVGADAAVRLAHDLKARWDTQIDGPFIRLATVRQCVQPDLRTVLQAATLGQQAEQNRLYTAARATYAPRDSKWWSGRFEAALVEGKPRAAEPLRVLIPACRYSTFVKHSASDLAAAFERLGCNARLLMEPDNQSHLSSVAYLRALNDHRPDLIVLINYTRHNVGPVIPPEIPFVCWIQDAMPHLFDDNVGRAQTSVDFLVGHMYGDLFNRLSFPRQRTLAMPVVADAAKFHNRPVAAETRRRFECEVAYVSHHSETPDAMHARLMREAKVPACGVDSRAPALFESLLPAVRRIADDPMAGPILQRLRLAALAALRDLFGAEPDPRSFNIILNQYCLPLADRILRHRTLAWAAQIAGRRGWRLRIHGRGWERHPTLAPFAAGELPHGDDLRACYQSAAVNLHLSVSGPMHQRVLECVLSGGLPVFRRSHPDPAPMYLWAKKCALERVRAKSKHPISDDFDAAIADHPELMLAAAQFQRLGLPLEAAFGPDGLCRIHPAVIDQHAGATEPELSASWVLGDLADASFADVAGLEALVARAIESSAWRSAVSTGAAGRVRQRLTTDVMARRILDLVGGSLRADAASRHHDAA